MNSKYKLGPNDVPLVDIARHGCTTRPVLATLASMDSLRLFRVYSRVTRPSGVVGRNAAFELRVLG
jgi:hypothetical protein